MARLFLEAGQTFGTVAGFGSTDVVGTNSNETVLLTADAKAVFDSSFNRGGDVLNIAGNAGLYTGTLVGSRLILTASNGANISIPVGTVGTTIHFADADRSLIFSNGNVLLGSQIITAGGVDITDGNGGSTAGAVFNLTSGTAAGADVMHITGNISARTDLTKNNNQVTGLDLNQDGQISLNGVEAGNGVNVTPLDDGKDFEIVDAYVRNRTNYYDTTANYLGSLLHDGTGFGGDGTNTNGNIVLGGLGADTIFGGIGNDFLVGGGVLPAIPTPLSSDPLVAFLQQLMQTLPGLVDVGFDGPLDMISGGRNADFFFADFSTLSFAEGDSLFIDAGTTADDTSAETSSDYWGGQFSSQDSDWLLGEFSDDEEPIVVELREGDAGTVYSEDQVSQIYAATYDMENFDASGNLYGFLDDLNVSVGEGGKVVNGENVGIGSSAQLVVSGSEANNIIIGGYDNDRIYGDYGDDLLMGGNLKYALNNPNAAGIVNDGMDKIYGEGGNDSIVFEADNGVIDGGDGHDVLYLTSQSLGTKTAAEMTKDGVLRFDLLAQSLSNSAGYGGADTSNTQDQTNYSGAGRVNVSYMDSVVASGMGAIDYYATGGNPATDLEFRNQQNHLGYQGMLDLRGDNDSNDLFASTGKFDDTIEGREGDDYLSGGDGSDDFIFGFGSIVNINNTPQTVSEDGVDVILRERDVAGGADNLWDRVDASFVSTYGEGNFVTQWTNTDGSSYGTRYWDTNKDGRYDTFAEGVAGSSASAAIGAVLWSPDFGQVGDLVSSNSKLTLTLDDTNRPDLADFPVDGVIFALNGTQYTVSLTSGVQSTYAAFTAGLNAALDANASLANLNAVLNGDNTITITDPSGRVFTPVGYTFVNDQVPANGNLVFKQSVGAPETAQTFDRLIYTAYEDRADGERRDDDAVLGSNISLGEDGYAEDLVASFGPEGTRLAEDQQYTIYFDNLTTQDKVTVTVNGVTYSLQVGVDLDGNIIANEDGPFDNQAQIQTNFLSRLANYINSFMDDDTAAGSVGASAGSNSLTLTQNTYSGEETVFMVAPTVQIQNLSLGEPATYEVENESSHEVLLFGYNGRNNGLNAANVQFIGDQEISRSILETAKDGGVQTVKGSNAMLIDNKTDNVASTVANDATQVIVDSKATNANVNKAEVYSVHGDDFLIGGTGNDTITGGTGDDRVVGSLGTDTLDGGKNYYAVQVLGEAKVRVYELNKWEAANPSQVSALSGLTISSITLIQQSETGVTLVNGVYDDTLIYQQADFTAGKTQFTITLDNYSVSSGVVQLKNDGAGTVQVDTDGNGTFEATAKFTNFENVRTVSGVGQATADYTDAKGNTVAGGQGRDTLNVQGLSKDTGGILYNLTNQTSVDGQIIGGVYYSKDALSGVAPGHSANVDYESLVLRVDGVENVLGGLGNDVLLIDESEAAKDNIFDGGLAVAASNGIDRIEYQNDFGSDTPEPSVTIKVNTATDTDQVVMTGGRLGTVVATDTLKSVEYITLAGNTAQGMAENDLIDVRAMTSGAVVDYTNGQIRDLSGNVQLTIENIVEMENVIADGQDYVIVADADVMNNNARSDENNSTPAKDVQFQTYVDYDTYTAAGARIPFAAQTGGAGGGAGLIEDVINQNQHTFDMGEGGTDVDTVDYSAEQGNIVSVVNFTNAGDQYVIVDGDSDGSWTDSESRVDHLLNTEGVVAAGAGGTSQQSIIDLTSLNQNVSLKYQQISKGTAVSTNIADADTVAVNVLMSNLDNGSPFQGFSYVEYYDNNDGDAQVGETANWNRVEGSDKNEYIELTADQLAFSNEFNLRGGTNEVNYNEQQSRGISFSVQSILGGLITANVQGKLNDGTLVNGQDTNGNGLIDGVESWTNYDKITSSSNLTKQGATGTLRVEASQSPDDDINLSGQTQNLKFVLGTAEGSDDVVRVTLPSTDGAGNVDMTLAGFELLIDGKGNDVYDMSGTNAMTNFAATLKLRDNDPVHVLTSTSNDHDVVKVGNAITTAQFGGTTSILSFDTIRSGAFIDTPTFQFEIFDLSAVTVNTITTINATGTTELEVVLGSFAPSVTNINGFDTVVMSQAAVTAAGTTSFTVNGATNTLTFGAKNIVMDGAFDDNFSFGDVFETDNVGGNAWGQNLISVNTTGVTVTTQGASGVRIIGGNGADNLTGGSGGDILVGGGGNDTMYGGTGTEIVQFNVTGGLVADGNNATVGVQIGAYNVAAALTEGTQFVSGAGNDAIGAALASYITTNLAAINGASGLAPLTGASYDADTDILTLSYTPGQAVADGSAVFTLNKNADGGTALISAGTTTSQGGTGGADSFVFSKTAAANGVDTINDFSNVEDRIVVGTSLNFGGTNGANLFLGTATNMGGGGVAVNFSAGLDLSGAANVGVVFNKGSLSAADIVTTGTAGKIAVEDNGKAVVIVTADADGVADATNNAYQVYFIEDTNTTSPGVQTWAVTQVATLNSLSELTAANWSGANFG